MALGVVCKKLADDIIGVKIGSEGYVSSANSKEALQAKAAEATAKAGDLDKKADAAKQVAANAAKSASIAAEATEQAVAKGDKSAANKTLDEAASKAKAAAEAATAAKVAAAAAAQTRKLATTLDMAAKASIAQNPTATAKALDAAKALTQQTVAVKAVAAGAPAFIGKNTVANQVAAVANTMQKQGVIGKQQAAITKGMTLKGLAGLARSYSGDALAAADAAKAAPTDADMTATFQSTVKDVTEAAKLVEGFYNSVVKPVMSFFTGDYLPQSGPERDAYIKKLYATTYNGIEPSAAMLARLNAPYAGCRGRPCVGKDTLLNMVKGNPPSQAEIVAWYKQNYKYEQTGGAGTGPWTPGAGVSMPLVLGGLAVLVIGGGAMLWFKK